MSTCPATSALGHGHWGTSSQHRVYAALREFCNFEVRKTRRLGFNPVWTVELEAEITPEAQRWSAAEPRQFLAYWDGKPLGHTTEAMTDHYTHVMAAAHLEAAEKVARLVDQAGA